MAFIEPGPLPPVIALTTFSPNGTPTGSSRGFGTGSTAVLASNPVLAALPGGLYAAAWTDFEGDGDQLGVASSGPAPSSSSRGSMAPTPTDDRPALAELDATHLLLVYTEGADPGDSGVANSSKLRAAILDTGAPGAVTSFGIDPVDGAFAGLAQTHPNVVAAGERLYVAWRTEARLGDSLGERRAGRSSPRGTIWGGCSARSKGMGTSWWSSCRRR